MSSCRSESAPIWRKPEEISGVRLASTPPAITTSQAPERSRSRAVPSAVVPDAQAVTVTRLGPRAPCSMAR